MEQKHWWTLLVLTVAIAAVFLAVRQMSHSLWFDETQTAIIAQAPTLSRLVDRAMQNRPYPPLYFLFERVSWKLRGDEIGLRLPSAVFGALATIAIYFLGLSFFQARTAAAAALLFCMMPGMFGYFLDANPYTLLALTSILSAWTLWLALQSDRPGDWVLYVAAACAGLACHTLFVFHIGSHLLAGVAWKRSLRWRVQPRFYRAMAVVFALWMLWAVYYRHNWGLRLPFELRRLADGNLSEAFVATYAGFLTFCPLVAFFTWPVLQAAGAMTIFLRDKRRFTFLMLLMVPPVIGITLFTHATLDFTAYHYGAGIFPFTCLMGASVLESSFGKLAKIALAAVLAITVAAGASVVVAPVGFFDFQDWSGVAAFLSRNAAPSDSLLLDPGWSREALDYYDHGTMTREDMNHGDAVAPKVLEYCAAHPDGRKWLIVAVRGIPYHTAAQWKVAQTAKTGVSLRNRLEESGRVSVGPPHVFIGISVYPMSCRP